MKRIELVGDSIRKGYQEMVRAELAGWADVSGPDPNSGTSENILAHLDEWAITRQPDVLHLNCGLHDLVREFGHDTAVVPLDAYAKNVQAILSRVKSETNAIVVWALTTPVNQEWHHDKYWPFDRFEKDVSAYNTIAAGLARELGVVVNDLFAAITSAGRDDLLLPDGVHFKPEGYAFLAKSVSDCIRSVAEELPDRPFEATS